MEFGKKGHTGTNTAYRILEVVRCKRSKDLTFSKIVFPRQRLGGHDQGSIFEKPLSFSLFSEAVFLLLPGLAV
jgi:hypothetical protein